MAELKTKLNDGSVEDFLDEVVDEAKSKDCFAILELMKTVTKQEPKMWGNGIVGFSPNSANTRRRVVSLH